MLRDFLISRQAQILALTEQKSVQIAGVRPSSEQLKQGLPIFFNQLLMVLKIAETAPPDHAPVLIDEAGMARAAGDSNEEGLSAASGHTFDVQLAREAGRHGKELMRLGYTLSHVVHAYGAMCQAITETATSDSQAITAPEFRDLNRCLDVAIAGAVTAYQSQRNEQEASRVIEHLGSLAHELRNALATITISLRLIKSGTVGFAGSTGKVLDRGLKRMEDLVERSLTEVRLRVDPKVNVEPIRLLHLVDQIVVTADVIARERGQVLEIRIDPALVVDADLQLLYSALSNLIQNALKYTRHNGKVQVRGSVSGEHVVVEVEDECGGLPPNVDFFKAFEQQHVDRKGLGLGLTIAQRAIVLNKGTIGVRDIPGQGCVFKITLPKSAGLPGISTHDQPSGLRDATT
jgi:signal transduction histidine kinase